MFSVKASSESLLTRKLKLGRYSEYFFLSSWACHISCAKIVISFLASTSLVAASLRKFSLRPSEPVLVKLIALTLIGADTAAGVKLYSPLI